MALMASSRKSATPTATRRRWISRWTKICKLMSPGAARNRAARANCRRFTSRRTAQLSARPVSRASRFDWARIARSGSCPRPTGWVMKFKAKIKSSRASAAKFRRAGFTLAEVLAALALMAIVIPVAMQGLKIASLAGEVSQRKALAARVGERVLNESILTGQYQSVQRGTEKQGPYQFRWTLHDEPWN